ncbi:hypothetical protein MA16_Dca000141 [Dendrobium catenatum]|uniref:Uncharacterized protein n=1 Tax=Dendrobium catenatum TaxID=906689 RepID=A0A2I0WT15_9ASPA|nr:hypothetical protein MA16_Dca000141 [Dendrobium catenatum]
MSKPFEEAYELIEEMAIDNFQWPGDRVNPKRIVEIYESDSLLILTAQVVVVFKKLNTIWISSGSISESYMQLEDQDLTFIGDSGV